MVLVCIPLRWRLLSWLLATGLYPSSVEVDCGCIASLEVVRLREEFGTPIVDWKSFTVVKAGM